MSRSDLGGTSRSKCRGVIGESLCIAECRVSKGYNVGASRREYRRVERRNLDEGVSRGSECVAQWLGARVIASVVE